MVARRRARAIRAIGLSVWCATISIGARSAPAHPLHTTLVQLTYDARTHQLEGRIRVFAGDFAAAVARRNHVATPNDDRVADSTAFAYVNGTFRFVDASGRTVPLAWCGSRRANDLLWLCVRATSGDPLASIKLVDQMLSELFDDQINIVQTVVGEKHSSMLFTKGDGAKSIL